MNHEHAIFLSETQNDFGLPGYDVPVLVFVVLLQILNQLESDLLLVRLLVGQTQTQQSLGIDTSVLKDVFDIDVLAVTDTATHDRVVHIPPGV